MQRLLFEYSPFYFLLCLALGVGYAYLLYSVKYNWSKTINRILFSLRTVLATGLLLLLLGPILKQTENIFEKPSIVFLVDNSRSVHEIADSAQIMTGLNSVANELKKNDRQVSWSNLTSVSDSIYFNGSSSDLAHALRETVNRYEGKNLEGIVLVSDGIYNNGVSPLYQPLRIPVYTVGLGDTTQRADVVLRNVNYNRIVYQGNKFPLRAELSINGIPDQDVTVTVLQQGKVLQKQTKNSGAKSLLDFDFQLDAGTQGIQRLEVRVENVKNESNLKNNRASAFVEVVEGKKKILLLARSPHPDIKAIRNVLEKNPNYEFYVHIPGVEEADRSLLQPGKVDLIIAHQSPDAEGKTTAILSSFLKAKTSALIIIGQKTSLRALPTLGIPLGFEGSGQRDEVQTVVNSSFRDLGFSDDINSNISRYPPVQVPFGKFSFPVNTKIILHQRIGSVVTDRPLLMTMEDDQQKIGVVVGEGIWKWRLNEFQETEKTSSFDELFSKLFQYLSTRDDRRKFRSFPLQHEFTSDGPAVLESQVYNDLFEPVYGNTIDIELRDEQNKITNYRYVTGAGNSRYRIGNLKEGIYRYKATTEVKGKKEEVRGEFLMTEQNQEEQNLTADFGLLRQLAVNTDGKFYKLQDINNLATDLSAKELKSIIHSEETFNPLINLKAVFFILLLLISTEWFVRKFMGSY
ncbi:MAG: VWA domain-containing protein [Cyclobacteriaceae bacterium]|nr:VWA domain-containing protein [Cyclobacteriaceae bacterium]